MAGHYCTEHEQEFKRKGKDGKFWYSHSISDTGKWCNEPKEGGDPIPEETASSVEAGLGQKTNGKNRAFALSYAKDIAVAKIMMGSEMTPAKVITTAILFESYLDNGATVE